MTQKPERFTQEIVEVLPADLLADRIDYRPKGIKRLDRRKTCLDCGYLHYVRIRQVGVADAGNPVFERNEGVINTKDRSEILSGGGAQIRAKDLSCFRGVWSATYSNNVRKRIKEGLEQATKKRRCRLFFRWSATDSPETHRELHREESTMKYNIRAALVGAVIGGILSLAGIFLYWYLSQVR